MAPAPVLQVFGQPASTDVARVLACLFERNLHFQLVRTDAVNRAQHLPAGASVETSWYPSGHVTLKHGGTILSDSRDICRYVCTEFPRDRAGGSLYGEGSLERASVEKWLRTEARCFDAPCTEMAAHYCRHLALAPTTPADDEGYGGGAAESSERRLRRVLDVYDDALARNRYLAGDEFSLADLSHLPNAHRLAGSNKMGRRLLGSVKNVARWYEAVSARPAWQRVVATQSGAPHHYITCYNWSHFS
uniref:Uncharacterized protein n=1 Tax=Avena sativa TaxID=4498 RepID=A0ACD5TIG5_AVESA